MARVPSVNNDFLARIFFCSKRLLACMFPVTNGFMTRIIFRQTPPWLADHSAKQVSSPHTFFDQIFNGPHATYNQ